MDELKELLKKLQKSYSLVYDTDGPDEMEGKLSESIKHLEAFLENTAYVVPKCPKCGNDTIWITPWGIDDKEYWDCSCYLGEICGHETTANTPAEAAEAFGNSG